ncbi:MAG: GNAT family N-acetyltransferase [Nitrospira sp.]
MFKWINHREEVLLNAPYKPVSETQHQTWFESIQQRSDLVVFGIRVRKNDKLIGSCQLHGIHPIHRTAELQIRVGDASARNSGNGTEAIHLLLNFAFKDLNLHRVHLHVFATNTMAIRAYEKVGFVREGMLRKAAHVDGTYVDIVLMALLREEYGK